MINDVLVHSVKFIHFISATALLEYLEAKADMKNFPHDASS